ncbi:MULTISPECIES: hypothetical protein [unclassified Schlesneria]|uniref:hypothetical protein n=1 Tax=Schlesneria TaxID=656899 RepID=UPI002EE98374
MDELRTLFVGGYADGEWMQISPETTCVRMPFKNPFSLDEWDEEVYLERVLAEDADGRIRIFASETLTDSQAIEVLLKCYSPSTLSTADTKEM